MEKPGHVYAFATAPGQFKVGYTQDLERRMRTHQTSHPSALCVAVHAVYLNATRAEAELKRRLKEAGAWIRGEHFKTTEKVIRDILEDLTRIEQPKRQQLQSLNDYMQSAALASNQVVPVAKNTPPALAHLLHSYITRNCLKSQVASLIQAGLSSAEILDTAKWLQARGLVVVAGCNCVVIDKSSKSKLELFFSKTVFADAWRDQLVSVAAIDSNLKLISVKQFARRAGVTPYLKTIAGCD